MEINEITGVIIDASMKVHTRLGPGLLESANEACLVYELVQRGLKVESQVPLPIIYETQRLEVGYRLDLVVEDQVIVELKATEKVLPILCRAVAATAVFVAHCVGCGSRPTHSLSLPP